MCSYYNIFEMVAILIALCQLTHSAGVEGHVLQVAYLGLFKQGSQ